MAPAATAASSPLTGTLGIPTAWPDEIRRTRPSQVHKGVPLLAMRQERAKAASR